MRYLSLNKWYIIGLIITVLIGLISAVNCAAPKPPAPPPPPPPPTYTPSIVVDPTSAELSPRLAATPVTFTGSGWAPREGVVVELVGARPGNPTGADIPVAQGAADGSGNMKITMDTIAKLGDILGVGWVGAGIPDFSKAKPIAPQAYTARATGLVSKAQATCIFTLTAPAPK